MRKVNHFTKEFKAKYSEFCRFFEANKNADRKAIYCLWAEIEDSKIPVVLYDGLTNRRYTDTAEVWRYLVHYWLSEEK
jgi:hypothetical protein